MHLRPHQIAVVRVKTNDDAESDADVTSLKSDDTAQTSTLLSPSGFVLDPWDQLPYESAELEVREGFNMILAGTEMGVLGSSHGTVLPSIGSPSWTNLTAWLRRCEGLGVSVVLSVGEMIENIPSPRACCNDSSCWDVLLPRVRALKDYKAIAAWYTGDEPESIIPAAILREAHDRIRQIDSRPVMQIFGSVVKYHQRHNGPLWQDYVNGTDIIVKW